MFSINSQKFGKKRKVLAGKVYTKIIEFIRSEEFYEDGLLIDDFRSRLNLLTIILAIVIKQLLRPKFRIQSDKKELNSKVKKFRSGQRFELARDLIEIAIDDIDGNLREIGVGDMKFGKKMKNIALTLTYDIEKFVGIDQKSQQKKFVEEVLAKHLNNNYPAKLLSTWSNRVGMIQFALAKGKIKGLLANNLKTCV